MKNIPYIKLYSVEGVLLNPIREPYESTLPNRKQRRGNNTRPRFIGNNKGNNLTIGPGYKFRRRVQIIAGANKRIEHYDLCK